MKMKPPTIFTL